MSNLNEKTIKDYIKDTYDENDTFLCGYEVYARDELSIESLLVEIEEGGLDMGEYISSLLMVKE